MRRVSTVLAFLLGLAGPLPASAVKLDRSGSGQVLLFPFVNAEQGWDTLINLYTEAYGNVLRLRVLDPEFGRVVDSFNVYVGADENVRLAVTRREDDSTALVIGEGGCLVADDGAYAANGEELTLSVPTGMVEVYVLGVRLSSDGEANCDELAARWAPGGVWRDADTESFGLFELEYSEHISGHFSLVNVQQGMAAELPALGLQEFAGPLPHTAPDAATPALTDADPVATTASGEEVIPESGEGIDAIAYLLEQDRYSWITSEVVTDPGIGASTDWIISYPLTGYRLYRLGRLIMDDGVRACSSLGLDPVEGRPTVERSIELPWSSWGGGDSRQFSVPFAPVPQRDFRASLCNAVNTLGFARPSVFLPEASPLAESIPGGEKALVVLPNSTVQLRAEGPVVAFRATTFVNGTLVGGSVLANYMIMKPHQLFHYRR